MSLSVLKLNQRFQPSLIFQRQAPYYFVHFDTQIWQYLPISGKICAIAVACKFENLPIFCLNPPYFLDVTSRCISAELPLKSPVSNKLGDLVNLSKKDYVFQRSQRQVTLRFASYSQSTGPQRKNLKIYIAEYNTQGKIVHSKGQ